MQHPYLRQILRYTRQPRCFGTVSKKITVTCIQRTFSLHALRSRRKKCIFSCFAKRLAVTQRCRQSVADSSSGRIGSTPSKTCGRSGDQELGNRRRTEMTSTFQNPEAVTSWQPPDRWGGVRLRQDDFLDIPQSLRLTTLFGVADGDG